MDIKLFDGRDAVLRDEIIWKPDFVRIDGSERRLTSVQIFLQSVYLNRLDDLVVFGHGRNLFVDLSDIILAAFEERKGGARFESDCNQDVWIFPHGAACARKIQNVGEDPLTGVSSHGCFVSFDQGERDGRQEQSRHDVQCGPKKAFI